MAEPRELLGYHLMDARGRCDFEQLRQAVGEATGGYRDHAGPFDPTYYPGHQMVEGINYNSLDRIVTAFVDAAGSVNIRRHPTQVAQDLEVATTPHCARCAGWPAVHNLDGDDLCLACCNKWARAEGHAAFDASADRNPEGGNREDGFRAKHESAVPPSAGDAQ